MGVFCQVKTGGDLVRDRALKFLHMKLKTGSKELLNKEGEIHLFEEIKACTFEVLIQCLILRCGKWQIKNFFSIFICCRVALRTSSKC